MKVLLALSLSPSQYFPHSRNAKWAPDHWPRSPALITKVSRPGWSHHITIQIPNRAPYALCPCLNIHKTLTHKQNSYTTLQQFWGGQDNSNLLECRTKMLWFVDTSKSGFHSLDSLRGLLGCLYHLTHESCQLSGLKTPRLSLRTYR
mgnify:CR=1 FL=1